MSQLATAIRVTAVVSGGEIISRALQAGAFVLLARTFGQETLGLWAFAVAMAVYAVALVELGFDSYAVRAAIVHAGEVRALLRNVLGLRLAVALFLCSCALIYGVSAGFDGTGDALVVVALVLSCPSVALASRWKLIADQRAGALVTAGLVSNTIFLAAAIWASETSQILFVAIAKTTGDYFAAASMYRAVAREQGAFRPAVDFSEWRRIWIGGLPFGMTRMAGEVLHHVDVILLGILMTTDAAGQYVVAFRFILLAHLVFSGVQAGLYPILSRSTPHNSSGASRWGLVWRYAAIALGFTGLATALLYWFAGDLLTLLFGPSFASSAPVLRVLSMALPFACLRVVAREALRANGHERKEAVSMAVAAVLKTTMGVALIPVWGVMACAVATVASEIWLSVAIVGTLIKVREANT